MNLVYLHIITVHLPVVLTPVMIVWIFSSLKKPSETTWKKIYSVTLLLTFITAVSYFTGPSTANHVKEILQSYRQDLVEDHALWGRVAFVLQVFSGLMAIMGLSAYLQGDKPVSKLPLILLLISVLSTLVLLYTAHLGGMIRRVDLM